MFGSYSKSIEVLSNLLQKKMQQAREFSGAGNKYLYPSEEDLHCAHKLMCVAEGVRDCIDALNRAYEEEEKAFCATCERAAKHLINKIDG